MPHRISLMIHTASADWFLKNQGIDSYFTALLDCLGQQTFQSFELVYVDANHEINREKFAELVRRYPFTVKHVPVHHEHRYWFDKGFCFIAAAKNTGILYADGELLVTCDDAEFFPTNMLQRYWDHYRDGRYMHALHKRLRSIVTDNGLIRYPISGDEYVNDHRWKRLGSDGLFHHRHGSLCFAGTSFSLGDALVLNGFNERMDGCKSLEDCDFGNRLRILGRSFVMDRNDGYLHILDHSSYGEIETTVADGQETALPPVALKKIGNYIAVENHGMLRCAIELQDYVANKHPLTPQHLEIIQRDTIYYRKFDPLAADLAEQFAVWRATPTFDLRKQREEIGRAHV